MCLLQYCTMHVGGEGGARCMQGVGGCQGGLMCV